MKFNCHFDDIAENYLFAEVANRAAAYSQKNPDKKVLKLGIGDVTLPLAPAVIKALHDAVDDMSKRETFRGYGPYEGYDFLRESIKGYYSSFGVDVRLSEIFVSDPVYPVYVDTNLMAGRKIIYANATAENGFLPLPEKSVKADIIYICSPNNPTGAAYDKEGLKEWVDYANSIGAVILYDAAYECFVSEERLARSIFQIDGARTCAIEFCSFSKIAGFTGTRCGYTVIPEELKKDNHSANKMWLRRQSTKFNGVPYIVQRGAAAVFTPDGRREIEKNIAVYRRNAKVIADAMDRLGIWYTGGKNSPYIWLRCPNNMGSWEFFDYLLENAQVVGTPGEGFGKNGAGFFRLTAFGSEEVTKEAVARIENLLK